MFLTQNGLLQIHPRGLIFKTVASTHGWATSSNKSVNLSDVRVGDVIFAATGGSAATPTTSTETVPLYANMPWHFDVTGQSTDNVKLYMYQATVEGTHTINVNTCTFLVACSVRGSGVTAENLSLVLPFGATCHTTTNVTLDLGSFPYTTVFFNYWQHGASGDSSTIPSISNVVYNGNAAIAPVGTGSGGYRGAWFSARSAAHAFLGNPQLTKPNASPNRTMHAALVFESLI